MGRRVIQGLMFTLLVTLAMLGVRPGPAAAGSLKMDLSYNCVCHVRCCDDKKNCSADYRPWTSTKRQQDNMRLRVHVR